MSSKYIYLTFEGETAVYKWDAATPPSSPHSTVTRAAFTAHTKAALEAVLGAKQCTIYVQVMSVSRSGMQRRIRVYVCENNSMRNWSQPVAEVLGWRFDDKQTAVVVDGVGMDMRFHLIATLRRTLHLPLRDATRVMGYSVL